MDERGATQAEWHRGVAEEAFNRTWELPEQANRTPENDRAILEAAEQVVVITRGV